jgi:hypothetical protein
MRCEYQCHEIGGPWIAENPDCPVHGREAQLRERAEETDQYEELELRPFVGWVVLSHDPD